MRRIRGQARSFPDATSRIAVRPKLGNSAKCKLPRCNFESMYRNILCYGDCKQKEHISEFFSALKSDHFCCIWGPLCVSVAQMDKTSTLIFAVIATIEPNTLKKFNPQQLIKRVQSQIWAVLHLRMISLTWKKFASYSNVNLFDPAASNWILNRWNVVLACTQSSFLN